MSYSLSGFPLDNYNPQMPQKDPFLTDAPRTQMYQSSTNEPIPSNITSTKDKPIYSGLTQENFTEFMDGNVEALLKEQILLLKFIVLFLGFFLLSNILNKN
jgi:hypothetical protein